jgi:hypothetical protein
MSSGLWSWCVGHLPATRRSRASHSHYHLVLDVLEDRTLLSVVQPPTSVPLASALTAPGAPVQPLTSSPTPDATPGDDAEYVNGTTDSSSTSTQVSSGNGQSGSSEEDNYPVPPSQGPTLQEVVLLQPRGTPTLLPGQTVLSDTVPILRTVVSDGPRAAFNSSGGIVPSLPTIAPGTGPEVARSGPGPVAGKALSPSPALDLLFSLDAHAAAVDGQNRTTQQSPLFTLDRQELRPASLEQAAPPTTELVAEAASHPVVRPEETPPAPAVAAADPATTQDQPPTMSPAPETPPQAVATSPRGLGWQRYELLGAAFTVSAFLAWSHWYPLAPQSSAESRLRLRTEFDEE